MVKTLLKRRCVVQLQQAENAAASRLAGDHLGGGTGAVERTLLCSDIHKNNPFFSNKKLSDAIGVSNCSALVCTFRWRVLYLWLYCVAYMVTLCTSMNRGMSCCPLLKQIF